MLNDFAYTVDCITKMQDEAKKIASSLPENDKLRKSLDMLTHDLDTLHNYLVNMKEGAIQSESANHLRENLSDNYGSINGYEGRPNNSTLDRIKTLQAEMDAAEKTFSQIMNKYLPKINPQLKAKGQPELLRKTKENFDKQGT